MKPKARSVGIIFIVLLVMVGGYLGYIHYKTNKQSGSTTAKITKVIDTPNRAEDGYYGFQAVDKDGKSFSINAAPYLNVAPGTNPEAEASRECLQVPRLKVGQQIEFNLPESTDTDNTSTIFLKTCFEKGSGSYFIKLKS